MPHYPDKMVARSNSPTIGDAKSPPERRRRAAIRLVRDGPVPRASCPHCGGHLDLSAAGVQWRVRGADDIGDRLAVQLTTLEREELHVVLLNTRNVVIEQQRVYQGNVSTAAVRVGELFKRAVERHASSIILCHNHPSGDLQPSSADLSLTRDAIRAGRLLDIALLDHLIVGGGTFVSLRELGVSFDEAGARQAIGERGGPPVPDHDESRTDAGREPGQDRFRNPVRPSREDDEQVEVIEPASPRLRNAFAMDGNDAVGPDGTRYSLYWAVDQLAWIDSLPGAGMPAHQYVVIGGGAHIAIDVLSRALRDHPDSFYAYFRGYQAPMRYLELGGWRYWRTVLNKTHMLNRCRLDSVEPPRRKVDGAKPIRWDGPPWAPYGSPWPPGYAEVAPGRWVYRADRDWRRGYQCYSCGKRYWLSAPERPCPRCGTEPPHNENGGANV